MCDRASYMKMTRRTNLMQQLWFIIICSLYMFRTSIYHYADTRNSTYSKTNKHTTQRNVQHRL